jgi:hypothetical protein
MFLSSNKFKRRKWKIFALIIFFLNILIISQIAIQPSNKQLYISPELKDGGTQETPQTSAQTAYNDVQWLQNNDFDNPSIDPWLNTSSGDSGDIEASNSTGQADILVIGDEGRKEISNVFEDTSKWTDFNKSELDTYPDYFGVDQSEGVWCNRSYDEDIDQENQYPKIYWRYNVSMGMDMSDYEITSASIEAVINASVAADVDAPDDLIAHWTPPHQSDITSDDSFDSVYFTAEISDMDVEEDNTYLIADNRTIHLGSETFNLYKIERTLTPKLEDDLSFYLERVLEADPGHDNFTLILGVALACSDNSGGGDRDVFEDVRFKSLNLTFTYKKKVDKYTTLRWYQEGEMINYTSVQVTDAQVYFDYKINKDWNETTSSQFSEFRIFINNKMQIRYPNPRLVNYDYSTNQGNLIEARTGGFDVTSLIPLKENLTLAIQVYLGDNFELNETVTISIDNVDFLISYIVFYNATGGLIVIGNGNGKGSVTEEPWIFLFIAIASIAGGACLGGYLIAYQLYLKYPKPVRKIRKYRKTLKKKESPSIDITGRDKAFNTTYKSISANILSDLKGKPKIQMVKKEKIAEKIVESKPPEPVNKK